MSLTVPAVGIETFRARLGALAAMLDKLKAHAAARKIEEVNFLQARLAPDMFHLAAQVQVATDFANRGAARLAGVEPLTLPDVETTIEELQARIARVLDFIAGLDPAAIEAGAQREVTFRTGPEQMTTLPGAAYLTGFAMPNFYFHVSMAYALMRHNGLEIGKRDFFGSLPA